MGVKRTVDTDFWRDDKVMDDYSVEDKYFMLYLYTCPNSELIGMYKLPLKIISFETGYTVEIVKVLLDRFENNYKIIKYDYETQEILILNYIKKAIIKGGKPIFDAFKNKWNIIRSSDLKDCFIKYHSLNTTNRTLCDFLETLNTNSLDKEEDKDKDKDKDKDCNATANVDVTLMVKELNSILKKHYGNSTSTKFGTTNVEKKLKVKLKDYSFETIKTGYENYLKQMKSKGTELTYIKGCEVFLNQETFIDYQDDPLKQTTINEVSVEDVMKEWGD